MPKKKKKNLIGFIFDDQTVHCTVRFVLLALGQETTDVSLMNETHISMLFFLFPLETVYVETVYIHTYIYRATQVAQVVKNLPANAGTQVQSLGQEDPQEREMATHSNIFAWEIPWAEEHGRPQTLFGVTKEADMTEQLNNNVYSN